MANDIPGKFIGLLIAFVLTVVMPFVNTTVETEMLDRRSIISDVSNFIDEVVDSRQVTPSMLQELNTNLAAYGVIDEMTTVSKKAIDELGIDVDAFGGDNSEYESFEGHTREQWINDLKTRVSEIQDARRIKNIDVALPLIEKWLSDDDMFTLDMEKIEALLGK